MPSNTTRTGYVVKLSLPLLFLLVGSMSGCVLDPATMISDSIMAAADAAGPSDAENKAEHDAYMLQALVADDRTRSCAHLTAFWPEVRASQLNNPPNGPITVEAREQVMAEKGCVIPSPLAQSTTQAKPSTSAAVDKPTAAIPMAAAPINPSAATSGPAVSTSFAASIASETPERYRNRSCDYLHARLIEIRHSLTGEDPEGQQWAQKAKTVVSEVLVDNNCGSASWVGGRVGGVIYTIDPMKAPRLKLPLTGVWVEKSLPGGSFEKAGVLRGDTIVAVNDIPVVDASELLVIILKQPIGSTIRVRFWRVSAFIELPVVVAAPAA